MTKKLREDIGRVGQIIYKKDLDAKLIPEFKLRGWMYAKLSVVHDLSSSDIVCRVPLCWQLLSSKPWFCHNLRSLGYKLW